MDTARRWLAGIRRCLALAGLLTLAYLVIFFCLLADTSPTIARSILPFSLFSSELSLLQLLILTILL
jgi:hypothetical protein